MELKLLPVNTSVKVVKNKLPNGGHFVGCCGTVVDVDGVFNLVLLDSQHSEEEPIPFFVDELEIIN